jgi:hypothetical protein
MGETRKLAAILVSDVVGYPRPMGEDASVAAGACQQVRESGERNLH